MKDVITTAIKHPLATVIVIGSFAGAIAKIIMAAKGVKTEPVITIVEEAKKSE